MTPSEAAAVNTRARALYRSAGFRKAYVRGASARYAGLPAKACPYRNKDGWSAWRSAWMAGWAAAT